MTLSLTGMEVYAFWRTRSHPNPKTPKTPTYVGIGTSVHRTTMVDGRRQPWQPPPPWRDPLAQNHGCHGDIWSDPATPPTRTASEGPWQERFGRVLRENTFLKGDGQFTTPIMPNRQIMPPATNGGHDGHISWLWRLLLYRLFVNALTNNNLTRINLNWL